MSEQPDAVVALRWGLRTGEVAKIPDSPGAPVTIDITSDEGVLVYLHLKTDDVAPWLSREEQKMILRAMKHRDACLNRLHRHCLDCEEFDKAVALLQSRLYLEEQQ